MMKALRNTILFFCLIVCELCGASNPTIDSLMRQLDEVIANRDFYLAKKLERIIELQNDYFEKNDDHARFNALVHLYDEYHPFNADSAYSLSLHQEKIARRIGDSTMLAHARLNRANVLCATGMYSETLDIMDSIKSSELADYLHPHYFHIKRTVYGRMEDYSAFAPEKQRYHELTNMYRDSIISVNPPGTLPHVITKADYLNVNGRPEAAIETLNHYMTENDLSEHEKAICAWTLSESYAKIGDKEKQKELVILSSISDLKSSVREYVSLRQLALLLYDEGDLDRAYQFMTIAVEDAAKCNARQRIIELNDNYPKINSIYVNTVQNQKKSLERTIIIITVLSLILLISLIYMRKQMIRIAKARHEIEIGYDKLHKVTDELKQSNEKLSEANSSIAEISELKEVYIGHYMDQCLTYIDKLDSYRKSIGKLVATGKNEDLKKLVKSTVVVDNELKLFYDQFDKTFLSLFPTFVEDLNNLLLPEEAIVPKKEGTLTPELRILALIRLGISDSDKIAKFLRYSLTTIYNYRTKLRNKAKGDRSMLETEILKIGRADQNAAI